MMSDAQREASMRAGYSPVAAAFIHNLRNGSPNRKDLDDLESRVMPWLRQSLATDDIEGTRRMVALDWYLARWLPTWLELCPATAPEAKALRSLPPPNDSRSAKACAHAVEQAIRKAQQAMPKSPAWQDGPLWPIAVESGGFAFFGTDTEGSFRKSLAVLASRAAHAASCAASDGVVRQTAAELRAKALKMAVKICLLDIEAFVLGRPGADIPSRVCPVLAKCARIHYVTVAHDEPRCMEAIGLVPSLAFTRSTADVERKRAFAVLDWHCRYWLLRWLQAIPSLENEARSVVFLPRIEEEITAVAVGPTIEAAAQHARRITAIACNFDMIPVVWPTKDAADRWETEQELMWEAICEPGIGPFLPGDHTGGAIKGLLWRPMWDAVLDVMGVMILRGDNTQVLDTLGQSQSTFNRLLRELCGHPEPD